MSAKLILGILAAIGVMAVCAAIFQRFWFSLIAGGPLFLGFVIVAVFLLGVFLGSSMRR